MRPRGFTFLEIVMAMVILYLILIGLLELFISGSAAFKRSKEYTTALFLAEEKAEELEGKDAGSVIPASGACAGEFGQYRCAVSLAPYDEYFRRLQITVTSPSGARARLELLARIFPDFSGVATDADGTMLAVSDRRARRVYSYTRDSGSFIPLPALPAGTIPSGMTLDWDGSQGIAGDMENRTLWRYEASAWNTAPTPPGGLLPSGIATSEDGTVTWVSDYTGRRIWRYVAGGSANSPGGWASYEPPGGMGTPLGIACDRYGWLVWVADKTAGGIWRFDGSAWRGPLAPPGGMSPAGVATDQYGSVVWVADRARRGIWKYVEGGGWSGPFQPSPAGGEFSGIATDRYGFVAYLLDEGSRIVWSYDGSTWNQVAPLP